MKPDHYDLIAIGGGTAGLVSAAGATYLGAKAALVEVDRLGGDCLWTGCVPSKALIASARAAAARRDASALGLAGASPSPDWIAVRDSMRAARDRVAVHDDPDRFRRMGVDVIAGSASFEGAKTVRVGDRLLSAAHVVIATGAAPSIPDIPGLAEAGFETHHTIFDLAAAPRSLAVIGGGPIGIEFAQLFARLGAAVTVFETAPSILLREDPDAARVVADGLALDGVAIETGCVVESVSRAPGGRSVRWRHGDTPARETIADVVLIASGRAPRIAELGLDRAGIATDRGVTVDSLLRTSVPGVWAAGDCVGSLQFTHVAEYHAKLVLRNALTPARGSVDLSQVPRVTYSDPEVAQIGPTEPELRQVDGRVRAYRYDFRDLDRAITDRETAGFVKLLVGPRSRLLGATIVGAGAGELIAPIALAMRQRLRVTALSSFIYPYPTMSEAVKRAADLVRREQIDSLGGRLLQWLVRRKLSLHR